MNAAIRFLVGSLRRGPQAPDLNRLFDDGQTYGERLADRVAAIGGSWRFIIGFSLFLVAWALLNTLVLARHAFDPFPFIFLNLMLSMLAALQAPIIMMSQNRQAAKDRLEARLDYETNLRSEAQIASLHDKIDLLLAMAGERGDMAGAAD
ncbi:DUF1003 domain-containing protein [Sphingobium yanoikuyae]|jgi:uncharacterized membrane protein|uniref:DUF1003 domain-containing protein n=1 Tax=Sphingobium yanoikuyae TaxID=13690 RepID=A0A0J9CZX5_SPHYA|nr:MULTISPECIES: DUF1003 domain-containing protein [Sphingobium]ATP18055.1 hypothetical protein BV87_06420 [Sphingobium yanoikuyae]KMW30617.1 membrane protein [Sphingobium yanoikuyae]MDH2129770.1 DUF1003 domain-containing protein [Sphingobium yanoikuyae]MDH2147763.1 DUF1003 domain-containing protein [Sphingobium yanoikuyae]MDH2165033.1 DUF1003 domain-containing protein [Sphingobium yanoikuyae]